MQRHLWPCKGGRREAALVALPRPAGYMQRKLSSRMEQRADRPLLLPGTHLPVGLLVVMT